MIISVLFLCEFSSYEFENHLFITNLRFYQSLLSILCYIVTFYGFFILDKLFQKYFSIGNDEERFWYVLTGSKEVLSVEIYVLDQNISALNQPNVFFDQLVKKKKNKFNHIFYPLPELVLFSFLLNFLVFYLFSDIAYYRVLLIYNVLYTFICSYGNKFETFYDIFDFTIIWL